MIISSIITSFIYDALCGINMMLIVRLELSKYYEYDDIPYQSHVNGVIVVQAPFKRKMP